MDDGLLCGDCGAQLQMVREGGTDDEIWRCPWTTASRRNVEHAEEGFQVIYCGQTPKRNPDVRPFSAAGW